MSDHDDSQIDIFSLSDYQKENDLHIIECSMIKSSDTNKDKLFSGYDDIKILTFSYGMSFIKELTNKFKTAEIIIGSSVHAKYDIKEVMANQEDPLSPFLSFQGAALRSIKRNQQLVNRIKNKEISIWLAKDIISHEKMYILTAENGNTRVIYGSANLSSRAFNGDSQRESLLVFDNDALAYQEALEEYGMIKDFCTQRVINDAIYYSKDGSPKNEEKEIEEIPIVSESIAKQSGIILNAGDLSRDDIEFAVDVSEFSRKFADAAPKSTRGKNGKIELKSQKTNELIRQYKKNIREKAEVRKLNPQFTIDYINQQVRLNDKEISLSTTSDDVANDINVLLEFYKGYDDFYGNPDKARKSLFLLMNYMFMTPLIGQVRLKAIKYNHPREYFPLFAVISGPKSAGKTFFVKTIHKFMYVKKMPIFSSDEWVKTTIHNLMHSVAGIPLLIDDIERKRFIENSSSIIKEDAFIDKESISTIPTFIITSNSIETSVEPAIKKRSIYLATDLTLDDVTAAHNAKSISDSLGKIKGAFYREYLSRAIPRVIEMMQRIETDNTTEDWHPDLFKLSSETIIEIINEHAQVPEYMSSLSFENYFGNNTVMRNDIRETILMDFEHNRSAFKIDRRKNELLYSPGEFKYEAKRVLDALPEYLEAKVSGNSILMSLDKAEDFLGIRLKKGRFW